MGMMFTLDEFDDGCEIRDEESVKDSLKNRAEGRDRSNVLVKVCVA